MHELAAATLQQGRMSTNKTHDVTHRALQRLHVGHLLLSFMLSCVPLKVRVIRRLGSSPGGILIQQRPSDAHNALDLRGRSKQPRQVRTLAHIYKPDAQHMQKRMLPF